MQPLRPIRARIRSLGPARVDALIAAVFFVEGLLEARAALWRRAATRGSASRATVLIAAGLAVRRRSPLAALALALAGFVAFQPLGREVNDNTYAPFFAVLFLLFSFGLFEPSGRRLLGRLRARLRRQRRRRHDRLVSEHRASTSSSAGS